MRTQPSCLLSDFTQPPGLAPPDLVLHVRCTGRVAGDFHAEEGVEADAHTVLFEAGVPVVGFLAGGELGPRAGGGAGCRDDSPRRASRNAPQVDDSEDDEEVPPGQLFQQHGYSTVLGVRCAGPLPAPAPAPAPTG